MGKTAETDYQKIIMVNIHTGQKIEAWGISAAARIFHTSTKQIRQYIETGRANRKGWTFDEEAICTL